MDERDDPRLDALLRQAAPAAAPAGFTGRVIAAARARRARQRLLRLAAAAAAALALGAAVRLWLDTERKGPKPVARSMREASPAPEPDSPPPSPAFAAVVASSGVAPHRLILGHFDNKLVVFARPNVQGADAPDPSPRAFAATVGYETLD